MKSLLLILSHKKYFAAAFAFATLNFWFGTWAIYIPTVKDKLDISKDELGIAIFFLAFGVFAVLPFASRIIQRLGAGKSTWYAIIAGCICFIFPLSAPSYISLCAALFVFGLCNGFLDIAMNSLVSEIETIDRVQFMSSAHGFFSLGGVCAGLGSFFIPLIDNPLLHVATLSMVLLAVNFFLKNQYISIEGSIKEKASAKFGIQVFKAMILLSVISFVAMGSEGAIIDWSTLFMKEVVKAPEQYIGVGFIMFSVCMTLGRFLGDGISSRVGSRKTLLISSSVSILAYVFILQEHQIFSVIGFSLGGLGFSVIIPELFRIGGKMKDVPASTGVSFIAGSGYLGFLFTPVILGFIAEQYSLTESFSLMFVVAIAMLVAIIFAKFPPSNH